MLGTVVPPSICRDMQHTSMEYARQTRDKMEEPGGARRSQEEPGGARMTREQQPCRERERDKEMLSLCPPLTSYLNPRPEDQLLFRCLACRDPNLMRRGVAVNRLRK